MTKDLGKGVAAKKTKSIPFDFVLEKLEKSHPVTNPMFGCHAIYVADKIVLMLRKKQNEKKDNGVWVSVVPEHLDTIKKILPALRPLHLFGNAKTTWQNIPSDAPDFEECVINACELILKNDPRIGKVPKAKKKLLKRR
jgi:hypothetical protein